MMAIAESSRSIPHDRRRNRELFAKVKYWAALLLLASLANISACWIAAAATQYDWQNPPPYHYVSIPISNGTSDIDVGWEATITRGITPLMEVVLAYPSAVHSGVPGSSSDAMPHMGALDAVNASYIMRRFSLASEATYPLVAPDTRKDVVLQVFGWPMRSMWLRAEWAASGDGAVTGWRLNGVQLRNRDLAMVGSADALRAIPMGILTLGFVVNVTCIASLMVLLDWARVYVMQGVRRRQGKCVRCGYSLRGNTSGTCPECGARVPASSKQIARDRG